MRTVKVGYVGVDSGNIIIADPCYVMTDTDEVEIFEKKVRFKEVHVPLLEAEGLTPEMIGRANGVYDPQEVEPGFVVSHSPLGDGAYPVYAEYSHEGTLLSLTLRFDEDVDNQDDDGDEGDDR